jgi:IPT/TIG domain
MSGSIASPTHVANEVTSGRVRSRHTCPSIAAGNSRGLPPSSPQNPRRITGFACTPETYWDRCDFDYAPRTAKTLSSGCWERESEMMRMAGIRPARSVSRLVLSLGLAWLTGCVAMGGGGSSGSSSSGVTVTPATADVRAGDTQQFSAKVSTMDQTVIWAVNGTTGGNATAGRISTTGVYTAPAALPTPNSVSIEATSSSNPSLSGKSSITLENPVPTGTAVSPTAVPVGNFLITVTGTNFVDGAKAMFGGQALTTQFVSSTRAYAGVHGLGSEQVRSLPWLQGIANSQPKNRHACGKIGQRNEAEAGHQRVRPIVEKPDHVRSC